jgi:hypothetical protein
MWAGHTVQLSRRVFIDHASFQTSAVTGDIGRTNSALPSIKGFDSDILVRPIQGYVAYRRVQCFVRVHRYSLVAVFENSGHDPGSSLAKQIPVGARGYDSVIWLLIDVVIH